MPGAEKSSRRKGNDLGEQFSCRCRDRETGPVSPSAKALVIDSFEAGYAAALTNVIALIEPWPVSKGTAECQSPSKHLELLAASEEPCKGWPISRN